MGTARTRTAAHLAALAGILVVALALSAAPPAAADSRYERCDLAGDETKLGATYVTSLRVSAVSCRKGKRLVKAFHRCRREQGGRDGRCRSVQGWRCDEGKRSVVPGLQYSARALCVKRGKRVAHSYTQDT